MPVQSFFPHVIDSSILGAARACPQKFFREYCQHFKARGQSVHLLAGGAYAHGLEVGRRAFYEQGKTVPEAEQLAADALCAFYGDYIPPADSAKTLERMLGALDFYFTNYPMDTDQARPIILPTGKSGIEFSFAEPLPIDHPDTGEPLIFCGRADMVVEFAGGVYLEDDKTTSSLGNSWSKNWEMRGQFSGYCWAARQIGLEVKGCLIRGVSILKTKYETQQCLTYRAPWEIDRWYDQTMWDIEDLIAQWKLGKFKYNLDESCAHYGGCQFQGPCKSPDPESWLTNDFEQRVWCPDTREELSIPDYIARQGA